MNTETLNSSDRQRAKGRGVNNQNQKLSNRDSRRTVDVTKTPQRKWGFKGARKYDENEALIPCGTARGEHTKGVGCVQSISQVTWLLLTSALDTIRDTCYARWRIKAEAFSTTFIPEKILEKIPEKFWSCCICLTNVGEMSAWRVNQDRQRKKGNGERDISWVQFASSEFW